MITGYGAEFVGLSKVPAGTTDFQQFVLAAEDAGADGVIAAARRERSGAGAPGGAAARNQAGLLGQPRHLRHRRHQASFGKFAKQIVLQRRAAPDHRRARRRWPILPTVITDLSASGEKELQKDQIKSSPFRSWVAVYHFKTIMENFGDPDNITRESVIAAHELGHRRRHLRAHPAVDAEQPSKTPGAARSTGSRTPGTTTSAGTGRSSSWPKDRMNVIEELRGQPRLRAADAA